MYNQTITIIGYGRFGTLLADILKDDFEVKVWDKSLSKKNIAPRVKKAQSLDNALSSEVIFLAIPISEINRFTQKISKKLKPGILVIDIASVKEMPSLWMQKNLSQKVEILNTHPMFGPDSAKNGLEGLRMVMCKTRVSDTKYSFWKKYFASKKLNIIEMTPAEHDKLAAYSQGITHYIGRVMDDMKLKSSSIDTKGFEKLMEVKDQTCNDTWELFHDLQVYNRYTKPMRIKLEQSIHKVYQKLLPERVNEDHLVIGIQGGEGSFNEEACMFYTKKHNIKNFKVKYLYTSNNVLNALHKGEIDFGQFAIQNSIGGTVKESVDALSKYNCKILDEFEIIINHCLLIHQDSEFKDIKTIMSHPQALAQCKTILHTKYAKLKKISGKGNLVDQATAAKALSEGKIPKDTAVIASIVCAQLYNLKVEDVGLQDRKDNYTSFLWCKRR